MANNNENKVLNVPNLRFPEFTEEWKIKSIHDLATVIGGGTPDTSIKSYWDGNIQWFTPSEIGKNKYVDSSLRTITKEGLNNSSAKLLPTHTILLSSRATVGECSISLNECTTNQGFQSLIAQNCNTIFLYYLIQTRKKELIRKACGSTFLEISANEVRKIQVNIPSDNEQKKIAEFLSLIDDRIATQNKIIEDLKKLKSAISAQLFEGHYITDNSTGWKIVTLGDITENFHNRNKKSDTFPMYSVTNTSGFSPQNEVFEGKEIKDEDISIYKIIHKGEFAYNPARINVGSIGKYDEEGPCMISSLYVCFRPTAEVDSDWLLYYLQSAKKIYQYGIFGEGGVRIYLFYPNFSRIEALLPPLKVQKEIASILKSFIQKIKLEELLLSKYQEQKTYLLSNMFI